jgi:hypothetical protein
MFHSCGTARGRSLARISLFFSVGVLLAGCGTFSGVDPVTKEKVQSDEHMVILETEKNTINAATTAADKKRLRNELQNQIIRLSDNACDVYLRGITKWDASRKLFFNSISIIAGGVAPLFSSGVTESLAVTSGLSTAANAEISSTVFQQLAVNLVESAIVKSRETRRSEIQKKQERAIAEYGVEAALRDSGNYHQLCALRRGLEILQAKNQFVAPSKVDLEKELKAVDARIIAADRALSNVSLTGAAREHQELELREAKIRRANLKALEPYAR